MARVAHHKLPLWKKISSRIKSIRKERGITDTQMAEGLSMDLKRYRKIERGYTEMVTLKEIMGIIGLLGACTEEIIPLS